MSATHRQLLGVSWVLRHAAVMAVLALTFVHLGGVVSLTRSQRQLAVAAEKAAAEARLPKASLHSVGGEASRLLESRYGAAVVSVSVYREARGEAGTTRAGTNGLQPGDRVTVRIAAPARPMMPSLLARLAPWLAREELIAEARILVP